MSLNTMRHDDVFDKTSFAEPVHLIGTGAVGSHVAMQLSKLGVGTHEQSVLHLYDGDSIESHNVANQAYLVEDIGARKATTLAQKCAAWSNGIIPVAHPEFVREKLPLSGIVMTCLDTMEARKHIGETSIWGNPHVRLLIDIRMDLNTAVVFTLDPRIQKHVALWDHYWFPDAIASDAPGCGGGAVVIDAVLVAAALGVRQLRSFASGNRFPNHRRYSLDTGEAKDAYW